MASISAGTPKESCSFCLPGSPVLLRISDFLARNFHSCLCDPPPALSEVFRTASSGIIRLPSQNETGSGFLSHHTEDIVETSGFCTSVLPHSAFCTATAEPASAESTAGSPLICRISDLPDSAIGCSRIPDIWSVHGSGSSLCSISFPEILFSPSRIAFRPYPVCMRCAPRAAASPNRTGICFPSIQTRWSGVALSPSYSITSFSPLKTTPSCETHSSPSQSLW